MKLIFNKPLQIGASLYGILYFVGIALPVLTGEFNGGKFENISVLAMFLFFIGGLIYSWFNEHISGLLFQIWYLIIWILSYFFWPGAGLVLVMSFPILLIGIFMYQNAFVKRIKNSSTKLKLEKHLLSVFMLNYAILYIVVAIPKLLQNFTKYLEQPYLIFSLLLLVFLISFIFSWKKELFAGILLIIWYLIVIISSYTSSEIYNESPSFVMGLTLLIQGILFIKYDTKQKKLKTKL